MSESELDNENCIAIVGIACNLPDAETPDAFWRNIARGHESVTMPSDADLIAAGVSETDLMRPDYVKANVPFPAARFFDPAFFGFSPRDSRVMDPQHRKFLECCWNALEHAGHTPDSCDGAIGVYAGVGMNWYFIQNVLSNRAMVDDIGEFLMRHLSNDKDFLSTLVSYQLDLKGPSLSVQTACSTSLVAIHLACQSLLSGECDMALAGGSTIELPQGHGYVFREGEVRSNDGHCRAFDANSSGTIFGSGCAAVLLRPLQDAIEDGDTVHAIIRGTAVNNDGSAKVSYLAPSVDGQAAAVREALEIADVDPETIGYVETHGTGTRLGDPIEIAAMTAAFGKTQRKQYCAIGSVKANIGHLDTAAGVVGLIKAVQVLKHQQIPPSLHFRQANPEIDFESSPFYVNTELKPFVRGNLPRRAAVNSLGVGGTNAYAILEEAPPVQVDARPAEHPQVLMLSAKNQSALNQKVNGLAEHLEANSELSLHDVAHTLRNGRVPMPVRTSVAATQTSEAIGLLRKGSPVLFASDTAPAVVFMFPGQGAQHPNMALSLYENEPVFRANMDECFSILEKLGRTDIRAHIYPGDTDLDKAAETLAYIAVTQPALFCVEYSLAKLLISRGIEPYGMIGHSSGEYVGACLAGVFTLAAAIELMCERGRLIVSQPPSAMIAVGMTEEEAYAFESGDVSVASVNGEQLCVLAGATDSIRKIEAELAKREVMVRRIQASHGGHTHYLDSVLDEFERAIIKAAPKKPTRRFISNFTGTWIKDEEAIDPRYWCNHLRHTVRFKQGIREMARGQSLVYIEVGPGNTLSQFTSSSLEGVVNTIPALPHPKDATPAHLVFGNVPGLLWSAGFDVDWTKWHWESRGRRIPLPVYPFQKGEYWLEPQDSTATRPVSKGGRNQIGDMFHVPSWQPSPVTTPQDVTTGGFCLLFVGDSLASPLKDLLANRFDTLLHVTAGESLAQTSDTGWTLDPDSAEDFDGLFAALSGTPVTNIVYAWPLDQHVDPQVACFDAPFRLLKSWQQVQTEGNAATMLFLSADAFAPTGTSSESFGSLLAGPARVAPNEMEGLSTVWVDVDGRTAAHVAAQIVADELAMPAANATVMYRAGTRHISAHTPVHLDRGISGLKTEGTYLITGGFGGLGYLLAEYLADRYKASLLLTTRTKLEDNDPRLKMIERLESLGARITVLAHDLQSDDLVARLKATGIESIDGVFHTAGGLDDGLIGLKSIESTQAVLAPKVQGTRILETAVDHFQPAFCLYYSSISALAGVQGQIDYASANGFLDSWAMIRNQTSGTRHIAVDWSAWRDTGMAAKMAVNEGYGFGLPDDAVHTSLPLLSHIRQSTGKIEFYAVLTADQTWILDEHRTRAGVAVLPGTGYIELLYEALHHLDPSGAPISIKDLVFFSPLTLTGIERRTLVLELVGQKGNYKVVFRSFGTSADDDIEHAYGSTEAGGTSEVAPLPLVERELEAATYDHPQMVLGAHWQCLSAMGHGDDDAIVELESTFEQEFGRLAMHPALLDMAIGAAQSTLASDAFQQGLVPYSYGHIEILAPLGPRATSVVKCTGRSDEAVVFDVDIRCAGEVVVRVRHFEMRVTRQQMQSKLPASLHNADPMMVRSFREGITNSEGMDAIERILASHLTHVVVAPFNLEEMLNQSRAPAEEAGEGSEEVRSVRPELSTPYQAPKEGAETVIADLWSEILGIDGVGVLDNFFELGGHSLLLTRIVTRLKQRHQMHLPLDKIFDQATVAEWAKLAQDAVPDKADTAPIKRADRSRFKRPGT